MSLQALDKLTHVYERCVSTNCNDVNIIYEGCMFARFYKHSQIDCPCKAH